MTALTAALFALLAPAGPEDTLAWLKSLDANPLSAQKRPRFPDLTLEDLLTLKELRLGGHRASDNKHVFIEGRELRHLAGLPSLEKLDLCEVDGLSDEAMAFVGKLTTLKELDLGDAAISSAGLRHLAGLKQLTRLQLGWTRDVGDAGLPLLAKLTKLEWLGLGGTKVTDAGLPALASLPNLRELALPGTAVTDRGIQSLAGCRQLSVLNLGTSSKVTPKGIDALRRALPALTVLTR
ncbi:MAG TPA: hypothetical protein VEJ18_16950 [Planctomycetota bacterium]|nr:hypothetical protein [Planctomycetota bacterium]